MPKILLSIFLCRNACLNLITTIEICMLSGRCKRQCLLFHQPNVRGNLLPLTYNPSLLFHLYHRQHLDSFSLLFYAFPSFSKKKLFSTATSFTFCVLINVFRPLVILGSVNSSRNPLFVACGIIGWFCLRDSGNSSHTVKTLSSAL